MFYNPTQFAFIEDMQGNWRSICDELCEVEADYNGGFVDWPEKSLYNQGWQSFGLYAFGRKLVENCERCPRTIELLERVDGLVTAGFSRMAPGAWIRPHVGYSGEVLRCHLGLVVNEQCGLRVGSDTVAWHEGKCLVFDDTVEHEAWNDGETARIVLLLDFVRPEGILPAIASDTESPRHA